MNVKEEALLFGKVMLNNKLASEQEVRRCLHLHQQYLSDGREKSLGDICVEQSILSVLQVEQVLEACKLSLQLREDGVYSKLAIKNGLLSESQIALSVQEQKKNRYKQRIWEILQEKGYLSPAQHRVLSIAQKKFLKARKKQNESSRITDVIKPKETSKPLTPKVPLPSPSEISTKKAPPSKEEVKFSTTSSTLVLPSIEEQSTSSPNNLFSFKTEYEKVFVNQALFMGFIKNEQVIECQKIQDTMASMGLDKTVNSVLIDKHYISADQLLKLKQNLPIESPVETYICDKKIGEGAMGVVYSGHLKGSDQKVALKVLHADYANDREFLRRFILEAQASIELDHPNIVRAYEVGVSGDYYYYSMEYIEGFSIKELLDEQPLNEDKAIEYALQISSALSYASEHHLVHRDIKPENIMIDKNSGQAKLCDLGIAKRLDKDLSLTQPGMAVGTPYYISPEQAKGNAVDYRSDIYSLGATLYHMVVGEVPYIGDSATEILLKHVSAEVPIPHIKNPNVSEEFSKIISKMMAKSAEDRVQSASDLIFLLEDLQEDPLGQDIEDLAGDFGEEEVQEEVIQSPIESYHVHRVLGQGAMGIVYAANLIGTDDKVALKVLLPHIANDKEFLRRFILEAQASMEFQHDNIVKAYDVGVCGDYFFYSMEWVEGESVKDLMDRHDGVLPISLALDIAVQVGEALCYAYEKQVVHRDIKPENIMFTNQGVAKLCDLGIAKQLSNDQGLTQPGMAVGSPYYIAPEQARGVKVDCRADLYALGASLFHMCTGTVPFEGYTAAAVMAKHVREAVPDPRERKEDLPIDISDMIVRMMQKKPEDRFESPVEYLQIVKALCQKYSA